MIRDELPGDASAIGALVTEAFKQDPHSNQTEAAIIERLRESGALTLSLVFAEDDEILGHIAFSEVTVKGDRVGWYGLGPVAVIPDRQGEGIGGGLIEAGFERLKAMGARGCVVLGEPGYYGRFGFATDSRLQFPEAPAEYFLALAWDEDIPTGTVRYHEAFYMDAL